MNCHLKYRILVLALTTCFLSNAQNQGRSYGKIEYRKDANYQGPEEWGANSPGAMSSKEEDVPVVSEDIDPGRIDYSEEEIQRYRQSGAEETSGNGDREGEIVQDPEPVELPEMDDSEPEPDQVASTGPPVWLSKLILILFIIGVALGLGYLLFRYRKTTVVQPNTPVNLEEDPSELTQSEFERLLAEALRTGNFREAIRLYFVAILKELIQLEWIYWKKDKTNQAYRNELRGNPNASQFSQCIRIYEYVWYGQYSLSEETFAPLELQMKDLLQKLMVTNAK